MRQKIQVGVVAAAGMVVFLGACGKDLSPQGVTPPPPPAASIESLLEAEVDLWARGSSHRGVSAAVIFADGEEWIETSGVAASGAGLTRDHLTWIASITKTMTGAVILQLAEEGALGLDDPVSKWLGVIPNVDANITLRQLLNHTNGLANYTSHPNLSTQIDADPTHVFTAAELVGFIDPKAFDPGTRTQYTNTSFLLLGLVAEAATGESITDLYHDRLWSPLGLTEIFLPGHESAPGPVATAWRGSPADEQVTPLEEISLLTIGNSAFGLFSNARTVARWGRALFTGQVFGSAMRSEMLEIVPAAGNIPGEAGAGLGIRTYAYLGGQQWGHSGGSPLGSSLLLYDAQSGITVAVLMNQGRDADHFELAPKLLEIARAR